MKNKFIVQICFQFILLNYSGAQTQDARYGSDITATTPLVPLRVLVVFVEFDQGNAPSATSYCSSDHGGGCNGDNITRVVLNTLDNTSPNNCNSLNLYTYFNGGGLQTTTLFSGNTYNIQVSFGNDNNQYFGAWIDFDFNGQYSTQEFLGSSINAGSNGTASISFTVPATSVNGVTHLRIVGGDNAQVTSSRDCNNNNNYFGETQDFDISIQGGSGSICNPINNPCWPAGRLPFEP